MALNAAISRSIFANLDACFVMMMALADRKIRQFGGLSPLVAAWLLERTANEMAPAFLIMASAAVTFATLLTFQETIRASLGVASRTTAAK